MSPQNYKKEVKSQHEITVVPKKPGLSVALKYFIYYCIVTVYNL